MCSSEFNAYKLHADLILKALLSCCSEKNSFSITENDAIGSSTITVQMTIAAKATEAE
jgi:hypothetical protein